MCGVVNLAVQATVSGEPQPPHAGAASATDGDAGTAWHAGNEGRLRSVLPVVSVISEIRILEGGGGPTEWTVLGVLPTDERMLLGKAAGTVEAGAWRTLAVTASGPYREIEGYVRSPTSSAKVFEFAVIGTPGR